MEMTLKKIEKFKKKLNLKYSEVGNLTFVASNVEEIIEELGETNGLPFIFCYIDSSLEEYDYLFFNKLYKTFAKNKNLLFKVLGSLYLNNDLDFYGISARGTRKFKRMFLDLFEDLKGEEYYLVEMGNIEFDGIVSHFEEIIDTSLVASLECDIELMIDVTLTNEKKHDIIINELIEYICMTRGLYKQVFPYSLNKGFLDEFIDNISEIYEPDGSLFDTVNHYVYINDEYGDEDSYPEALLTFLAKEYNKLFKSLLNMKLSEEDYVIDMNSEKGIRKLCKKIEKIYKEKTDKFYKEVIDYASDISESAMDVLPTEILDDLTIHLAIMFSIINIRAALLAEPKSKTAQKYILSSILERTELYGGCLYDTCSDFIRPRISFNDRVLKWRRLI